MALQQQSQRIVPQEDGHLGHLAKNHREHAQASALTAAGVRPMGSHSQHPSWRHDI
eukprot:CAMPEP_0172867394 /NCGR_PEP_ID=MMETSP1075-20121228/83531_1 /TAXON_ID=2916 /ORGANISM="Ceratium fusus, Strain PA161109" /LENGTH=55 /DNA_ID=CAMNT_0013716755 /DNA_START=480 /DNA_END=647 /DNA_ORIENTATION=-